MIEPKIKLINNIPRNEEIEKRLIGYIIAKGDVAYNEVKDDLNEKDFWKPTNQRIYGLCRQLQKAGVLIDQSNIRKRLNIKAVLVAEYLNACWVESGVKNYVNEIKRTSNLRKLINAGAKIEELGFNETEKIENLLDKTTKILSDIQTGQQKRVFNMNEMLMDSVQRFEERQNNKGLMGVESGYKDLDKMFHGFRKGAVYTIAARPGVGKTSFVVDIARRAAKKGTKVLMFSLEQPFEEIIDKITCAEGNINLWKMQGGYIDNGIQEGYANAVSSLAELQITIDDNSAITPNHIRKTINKIEELDRPDIVILDYLQLMQPGFKTSGEVEAVTVLSKQMKALAKEYRVPFLVLSQLNRGIENRGDGQPRLSDLRSSGSIEQDSDVVMFLQKKEEIKEEDEKVKKTIEMDLIIAKHRGGPKGVVEFIFNKNSTSFNSKKND